MGFLRFLFCFVFLSVGFVLFRFFLFLFLFLYFLFCSIKYASRLFIHVRFFFHFFFVYLLLLNFKSLLISFLYFTMFNHFQQQQNETNHHLFKFLEALIFLLCRQYFKVTTEFNNMMVQLIFYLGLASKFTFSIVFFIKFCFLSLPSCASV